MSDNPVRTGDGDPDKDVERLSEALRRSYPGPATDRVADGRPHKAEPDRKRHGWGQRIARANHLKSGLLGALAVAVLIVVVALMASDNRPPVNSGSPAEVASARLRATDLIGAAQLLVERARIAARSTGASDSDVRAALGDVIADLLLASEGIGLFHDALEVERARLLVADEQWRLALRALDGIWEREQVTGRPQREREVLGQHGEEYGMVTHPATSRDARIASRLVEVYEALITHAQAMEDDTDRLVYLRLIRQEKAVELDGSRIGWFAARRRLSADWAYALERALDPAPAESTDPPLTAARREARKLLSAIRDPDR